MIFASSNQSSLNVNQLRFNRSSAVDINDVILIKLIVTYYCLRVCLIHSYVRQLHMRKPHTPS